MNRLQIAKEGIRSQVKIKDLITRMTGRYFKGGKISCPLHTEKTASFFANDEKGVYYCQGCGNGGDIYKFVMDYNNVSFNESIRFIDGLYNLGYTSGYISAKSLVETQNKRIENERKELIKNQLNNEFIELCEMVQIDELGLKAFEPFSDLWCICMNDKICIERGLEDCQQKLATL